MSDIYDIRYDAVPDTVTVTECADIGPCMDVKAYNGRLYAIQRPCEEHSGRLCVLDASLNLLHKYDGIGSARQIEISENTAVITAREDGVWIFDISDGSPRLASRYRSVEYATGVYFDGTLAYISCRQYGVEVVDISDPYAPRHISVIRTGEVQSATVAGDILYCGCWGEMKVVLVDVADPANARILSEIHLQGRGDGVCVLGGILYAATGQHARGIVNTTDENDPQFGMGNGVEAFDVSDPLNVKRIGGTLFDKAYCSSVDCWEAAIYGNMLVVNDSVLGVYVIDPATMEPQRRFLPPRLNDRTDAVSGAAVLDGDLFFSTVYGGLYAARDVGLGKQTADRSNSKLQCLPQEFRAEADGADISAVYRGNFTVLNLDRTADSIILACAESGIHVIDSKTFLVTNIIKTAAPVSDVKVFENKIYAAEGTGGVEIFELDGTAAKRIGGFTDSISINQLMLSKSGKYLACVLSATALKVYDVSSPDSVKPLYSYSHRIGLFYGYNFASNLLPDGSIAAFCHRDGLITTNPDAGEFRFNNVEYLKEVDFCSYCSGQGIECIGDSVVYTFKSGYILLSKEHENLTLADSLTHYPIEPGFIGFLTAKDGIMVASARVSGVIRVIDISNIKAPKLIAKAATNSSPAKALICDGRILISGGRMGLLSMKIK